MDGSLCEPVPVPDTFCSGVGAIEAVGTGMLRFYLYVLQPLTPGMQQERVVVAKIVVSRSIVPPEVLQTLSAAGVRTLQPEEGDAATSH